MQNFIVVVECYEVHKNIIDYSKKSLHGLLKLNETF